MFKSKMGITVMGGRSDIIIVGGGIIGLSVALELKMRGASVTVLSRHSQQAAGYVGAGMLAPQAERIPPSPLRDLALRSRSLYEGWTQKLEAITGSDAGYWPCGILAPVYDRPESVELPQTPDSPAIWLEGADLDEHQPGLSSEVAGAWWFPKDAQVDNRRHLMRSLLSAARELGVDVQEGVAVKDIVTDGKAVQNVATDGGAIAGYHYILAAGAWCGQLLSIPVRPIKGQMLSLRVPDSVPELPVRQVLFGSGIYIVPRRDGLIVLGATVEDVGFDNSLTPAGIDTLLSEAMRLYPGLRDFPIQEFWWGFRPTTPDELPILGPSPFPNLTLATGHHRNGILLAPATAEIVADWVYSGRADPLIGHFRWNRFSKS